MTPSKRRARGRILTEKGLKKIQDAVHKKFPGGYTWQGISDLTYDAGGLVSKDTISKIWAQQDGADKSKIKSLFKVFGLKLDEDDHILALESHTPSDSLGAGEGAIATPLLNQNFVGREGAIAHLNACIGQGARVLVIQAAGGVGKTTLARQYLYSQGFDLVLELLMAKEKENITPVESVIEEWLKRDFQEEPGREFGVTLGRLKRQLQTRRVGVLIDNLEPALDKQGRFIELHRRYLELLRVLADLTVQSVTLITSRERLCESSATVEHYRLPGLDEPAWQNFFSSRHINIDAPTLKAMHNVYGGNAKAMGILCGAIGEDFDGDMAAYWQENSSDPLIEKDLEDLVTSQFNRLQQLDPDAYRLLCRLGCYRYQDVPAVPTKGLLYLLWDVPEVRHRRVIESLQNRSLVEGKKGEYSLHPVIRAEAIARLRESEDWEKANRTAANFWTESVKTVETVEDALRAFEAYYHYIEIKNFELAGIVIVTRRINKWETDDGGEHLGRSFYRLGLLQQMILGINRVINFVKNGASLGRMYQILGDCYWLTGYLNKAIDCHLKSTKIGIEFNFIRFHLAGLFNTALCQADMGEITESIKILEEVARLAKNTDDCRRYAIQSWYCLAFLKLYLGFKQEALDFAEKACQELSTAKWSVWAIGYKPLFLGMAYKNLGENKKSFEMYRQAILFAEETHYPQVKAKALTGLAELYREQGNFTTALDNHSESIKILDKIGAKCDLAEAHYQLALTYQKMENFVQSQENFDKAIQLFTEMEAPKQIERVRKSMQNH
ncbi:MAG: tetratricopeptide repeat protein [Oscillatoria princeps RMCB-10]|jgi:tetratricopeptide (TPR) repeat protein|nr:tetratricopeptide repeat protein [Oscillatoria princeps RMCB-10]